MLRLVLFAVAGLVACWLGLAVLAARLPAGPLRELAGLLPGCVTMVRRLARDPRVPRSVKIALLVAGLWVLSPIDLVPEFVPVLGPLDDAVVIALALRFAVRRVPREVLAAAWPGEPATLDRLVGDRRRS